MKIIRYFEKNEMSVSNEILLVGTEIGHNYFPGSVETVKKEL
jgi:hypothetical protein